MIETVFEPAQGCHDRAVRVVEVAARDAVLDLADPLGDGPHDVAELARCFVPLAGFGAEGPTIGIVVRFGPIEEFDFPGQGRDLLPLPFARSPLFGRRRPAADQFHRLIEENFVVPGLSAPLGTAGLAGGTRATGPAIFGHFGPVGGPAQPARTLPDVWKLVFNHGIGHRFRACRSVGTRNRCRRPSLFGLFIWQH